MKTDRNSFEPLLSILKIVYMCGVLLYFMFLTRNALGQTVSPTTTTELRKTLKSADMQRSKVRQIYISQIGVREKQPNSGPEVEKYLRYAKLPKGNPWCAAFVCWVFGEAAIPNPRTGWSPNLFPDKRVIWVRRAENGKVKTENKRFAYPSSLTTNIEQLTTPSSGDVFGIYFPEKRRIAHVGFVDEWKDPWVTTVEGNTNILGNRDGDGVYRKRRLVRAIYKVANFIN